MILTKKFKGKSPNHSYYGGKIPPKPWINFAWENSGEEDNLLKILSTWVSFFKLNFLFSQNAITLWQCTHAGQKTNRALGCMRKGKDLEYWLMSDGFHLHRQASAFSFFYLVLVLSNCIATKLKREGQHQPESRTPSFCDALVVCNSHSRESLMLQTPSVASNRMMTFLLCVLNIHTIRHLFLTH